MQSATRKFIYLCEFTWHLLVYRMNCVQPFLLIVTNYFFYNNRITKLLTEEQPKVKAKILLREEQNFLFFIFHLSGEKYRQQND